MLTLPFLGGFCTWLRIKLFKLVTVWPQMKKYKWNSSLWWRWVIIMILFSWLAKATANNWQVIVASQWCSRPLSSDLFTHYNPSSEEVHIWIFFPFISCEKLQNEKVEKDKLFGTFWKIHIGIKCPADITLSRTS